MLDPDSRMVKLTQTFTRIHINTWSTSSKQDGYVARLDRRPKNAESPYIWRVAKETSDSDLVSSYELPIPRSPAANSEKVPSPLSPGPRSYGPVPALKILGNSPILNCVM